MNISSAIAPSYRRAQALIAAGCPLDFPKNLPGKPKSTGRSFCVDEPRDYAQSIVFPLGPRETAYVITLRLRSYQAETVIEDWSFDPPWKGHDISWDYDPYGVIPSDQIRQYELILKSSVRGILDEGRLLARGRVVEGLLCGVAFQPIGESDHGWTSGRLNLKDHKGNEVSYRVPLMCTKHEERSLESLRPAAATQPAVRSNDQKPRRRITHEETIDPPRPPLFSRCPPLQREPSEPSVPSVTSPFANVLGPRDLELLHTLWLQKSEERSRNQEQREPELANAQ